VPTQVTDLVGALLDEVGLPVRCHFHNTRNTGLANAVAAVQAGVSALDASSGGIGGCPFAPGAAGNIATEDLVYLLSGMGVDTGLDLDRLIEAAGLVQGLTGHDVPGMLIKAGPFPRPVSASAGAHDDTATIVDAARGGATTA
jgi:hydroxymethylglutaryl-CoA lyase